MMAAAPATATSRTRASASRSSTRFQPSTATRPSEASMPTMTRSSKRPHTSPTNAGSRAARVPMIAHRAPASSTVSTSATVRRPPPTSTGMDTAARSRRRTAVWRGWPKAPSRSTTCSRAAPSDSQRSAMATGSSPKTVSASALPWRRRTQRPSLMSTAGTISKVTISRPRSSGRAGAGARRRDRSPAPPGRSSGAALPHEGGEVLEQPDPPPLALLGVELGREEHAPPDRRGEGHPVGARGDGHRRVRGLGIVRVHEVEIGPARDPVEEREVPAVLDLVPAHVGHLEPGREAAHHTGNHVEPLALAELLALGEQQLVAEADPQKRPALVQAPAQRIEQPERLQVGHGVVEGAVAG